MKIKRWGLKSLKQFVSGRLLPFFIAEQSSIRLMRETKKSLIEKSFRDQMFMLCDCGYHYNLLLAD